MHWAYKNSEQHAFTYFN